MQQDESVINDIIKKYKYLYNNKELILSLCIDKASDESYYLYKKVDDNIIKSYEEFLFSDKMLDETGLYQYVEFIKNNDYFLNIEKNKIDNIEKRRKYDTHLRNVPIFTVWKILTFIRNNNLDNKNILNKLDIYYNLDRYLLTGLNWNSGYELNDADILKTNDLQAFPSTIILVSYTSREKNKFIAYMYSGNEFEEEDNYLFYNIYKNNSKTSYMNYTKDDYLSLDIKEKIYQELNDSKTLKYNF